jgi:hypothetical protein
MIPTRFKTYGAWKRAATQQGAKRFGGDQRVATAHSGHNLVGEWSEAKGSGWVAGHFKGQSKASRKLLRYDIPDGSVGYRQNPRPANINATAAEMHAVFGAQANRAKYLLEMTPGELHAEAVREGVAKPIDLDIIMKDVGAREEIRLELLAMLLPGVHSVQRLPAELSNGATVMYVTRGSSQHGHGFMTVLKDGVVTYRTGWVNDIVQEHGYHQNPKLPSLGNAPEDHARRGLVTLGFMAIRMSRDDWGSQDVQDLADKADSLGLASSSRGMFRAMPEAMSIEPTNRPMQVGKDVLSILNDNKHWDSTVMEELRGVIDDIDVPGGDVFPRKNPSYRGRLSHGVYEGLRESMIAAQPHIDNLIGIITRDDRAWKPGRDPGMRLRWDMAYTGKRLLGNDIFTTAYNEGANDDHIDTALRQIAKELGVPWQDGPVDRPGIITLANPSRRNPVRDLDATPRLHPGWLMSRTVGTPLET